MFVKKINIIALLYIALVVNNVDAKISNFTKERIKNKMIEIGITHLPKKLDPISLAFMEHFLLLQCSAQTLVRVSESGKIASDLAEKWLIKEEGRIYEFHISEKARFSNGEMVTSSSVAYSISRHFWENSMVAGYLSPIIVGAKSIKKGIVPEGIKIISDKIIRIKLNKPYPAFLFVLAMPGFAIISNKKKIMSGPMLPLLENDKWTFTINKSYYGPPSNVKSIVASQVSTLKEALILFKENKLDLALGLSLTELDNIELPENLKITKTESLAFTHLYFNNTKSIFNSLSFRRDFSLLIQGISKKDENISDLQTINPYFIPRGIMPSDYYARDNNKFSLKSFKAKWGNYTKGKNLKIVLMKTVFKKTLLDELKEVFLELGIRTNLIPVEPKRLVEYMKSNDYDIIGGRYVGNFPDPDGFLDVIKASSPLRYGVIPTDNLFEEIEKVRYIRDQSKRLSKYSKILKTFEEKWYFVPLYRLKIPIVHNKKLEIPETNFRYESELWKIFWMIDNET